MQLFLNPFYKGADYSDGNAADQIPKDDSKEQSSSTPKEKRHKPPRPVDNVAQLEADEQDAKKAKNTDTIRHIDRLLHKKLLLLLKKALPVFG